MSGRPWQDWEDDLVIAQYPDRDLLAKLDRSWHAIRTRAGILGATRAFRTWKASEEREFLSAFRTTPIRVLAKRFPHRSVAALKRKAYDCGATGPGRRRQIHERPIVVEELRSACSGRGLIVSKLVRSIGGNPEYLRPRRISVAGVPLAILEKCADSLGGEIYVEWEDD